MSGDKSGYFLATTALEDFWDTSKPILFLGEWCRLYKRRSAWAPLNAVMLESPWESRQALNEAYEDVLRIYERLLPPLAERLNELQGQSYGLRYWRIVLGPWFHVYLSVIYDRYECLKRAWNEYPDLTTIGLSEESFMTPLNTLDFMFLLREDLFNLQIYTRILTALEKPMPRKAANQSSCASASSVAARTRKKASKRLMAKFLRAFWKFSGQKRTIFLKDSYFSKSTLMSLFLKTGGKARPLFGTAEEAAPSDLDRDARDRLKHVFEGNDEFERLLSCLLPLDIPQSFLENARRIREQGESSFPENPKAILSANAWYYDEPFRYWAAGSAQSGTVLIGTQHGGNYGGPRHMFSEDHELALTDRYYSWGWERSECQAKVIPFFSTKLTGRKRPARRSESGILWGMTSSPRYLYHFPFSVEQFRDYLSWQRRFLQALPGDLTVHLRARPHVEDNGWDIVARLKDAFPGLRIESWSTRFTDSLDHCRLYVCDHYSTTFTEALAGDKPTILFWEPEANELRPEAQPYFKALREVGVLCDSPESAAQSVRSVYDDVNAWWNDPLRQKAIQGFCRRFARTSSQAVDEWASELTRFSQASGMYE